MNLLNSVIKTAIEQKKIICIIHAPRVGSHALAEVICKRYELKNYQEIFHPKFRIERSKIEKPSLVKLCTIWHELDVGQKEFVRDDCVTIKLLRKDTESQILSYLYARYANVWHSFNEVKLSNELNFTDLIDTIIHYNKICDEINSDIEIYYEDLISQNYFNDCDMYKKICKNREIEKYISTEYRNIICNK